MHPHTTRRSLLALLLLGIPFSCKTNIPAFINEHAVHFSWGIATVTTTAIVGSAAWFLAKNNAKEYYKHLENEAIRKKEAAEKDAENRMLQAIAQKKTAERVAMENADNLLEQLGNLYEIYSSTPIDQLTRNKEFQHILFARVIGNNAQPKRLEAFNEKIDRLRSDLVAIDNPQLESQKKAILAQLNWYQQQANNSSDIIETNNQLTRKHYELEQVRYMQQIAAERALQEKIQTDSVKKVCSQNEEAAAINVHTSKELNNTAQRMSDTFWRQDLHIQESTDRIEQTIRELKASQASVADAAFIEAKLNTILQNQASISTLLQKNQNAPAPKVNTKKQAAHNAQQPQPSAPPFEEFDKFISHLPVKSNLPQDEQA